MTDRQNIQPFARPAGQDPVAIPLDFGDVLRRLRRAAGLSQEALAERATISWRTISDLERGIKRKPQQETFRLLTDALDLSAPDRALLESAARGPRNKASLAAFSALAAPAPLPVATHDLPVPMTPLVGRADEIAATCALVRRDALRLLTITGPGGVGKTRLVIAVATALAPDFPDGTAFVPLAAVHDPSLLSPTITHALGMEQPRAQSPRDALVGYLRAKRFLLVLDNFEQLTAAAGFVSGLLASCPHLTALITSRAALRIYGEHEYPITPLPLPAADAGGDLEVLARSAAVELFRQRAAAIRPGFVLTPANAGAVAEVCVRLDGLPLAIELAVARIRLFSPTELLARLRNANNGSSLGLLTDGARDAPVRQQTMRDAVAWSYDLLRPVEKALFRRLAVFAGGWTLEAAEAVCGEDNADIHDGIGALIDQSLIRTSEQESGETRFTMLETIREFAWESLKAAGEAPSLCARHVEFCLGLAEKAAPGLFGAGQAAWLGRLDADHENLRAALTWARDKDRGETGLRIAAALAQFWHVRGYLAEGRQWLETFLARAPSDAANDAIPRAKALEGLAIIATRQGDTALVDACSIESLALHRTIGDQRGIARALHNLGRAALVRTDYQRATTYYGESLALRREIGDRAGIAETLTNLGRLTRFRGEYARAEALLKEAVPLWREERDALGLAMALGNLGHMARDRGEGTVASPLIEESFVLYRELKNTRGISIALGQRALLAYDEGDYARARALSEESMALRQEIGDTWGIANSHCTLGDIADATGNSDGALAHYRESLAHYRKVGAMNGVADGLERIARLSGRQHIWQVAARLFGAAAALRESVNTPILPVDRAAYDDAVVAARAALESDAFEVAWNAGRALSVDEAIAATSALT